MNMNLCEDWSMEARGASMMAVVLLSGLFLWGCGSAADEDLEDDRAEANSQVRRAILMKPNEEGEPVRPWKVVAYEEIDGQYIAEGDIALEPSLLQEISVEEDDDLKVRVQDLAARDSHLYWPDGRIPYVIDGDLPDKKRVDDAIAHVENRTPLSFVERTDEDDYVRFVRGSQACYSNVGRIGGEQEISLADNCSTGAVIHEIGHAAGLWHEHQRSDRDNHVDIKWDNIDDDRRYNMETYEESGYDGNDIGAYDFDSVMHYDSYAFSKNGNPTILRKDGSTIDRNSSLSQGDIDGLETLYGGFDGTFADDDGNPHESNIEKIHAEGITKGCDSGSRPLYCPSHKVTRGQMAAFLSRALALPPAGQDYFDDDDGAWYDGDANRVAEAGVTYGCGDDAYCGDEVVTRGQMAAFLDRAFDFPEASTDYFSDDDGAFYEQHANNIAEAGVTHGCGGDKYCGDDPVTRDQMASFLARALGL